MQCIDKDLRVLRLQLEVLSQFSYSEPEALLQDLFSAIAFAEAGSPKKANGTDPIKGPYFAPKNTRPVSIVNTNNRLLAASLRGVLEPIAARAVSNNARGLYQRAEHVEEHH